jgi:PAS domain S-box-containing protein
VIDRLGEWREGTLEATEIERRLAAVLDSLPDGIAVQDAAASLVYVNPAAAGIFRFAGPAELRGCSTTDLASRVELVDETGRQLLPAALLESPAGSAASSVIGVRPAAPGDERWFLVNVSPLAFGGAAGLVMTTFHDVTERIRLDTGLRASEARYRRLVEAMPDIAWTTDPDGLVTMVNDRWAEYVGASPRVGTPLTVDDTIHPEDRTALADGWLACLASGDDLEVTARIRRHDGAFRWHLLRAVAVRDPDGAIQGWAGTTTDIDSAKRAEAELYAAEQAARRLAEAAADRTERLRRTTRAVAAAATATEVMQIVVAATCQATGARGGSIVRRDGDELVIGHAQGVDRRRVKRFRRFGIDTDLPIAEAIRTGQAVWLENLDATDIRNRVGAFADLSNAAACAVPMGPEHAPTAALGLLFSEPRVFSEDDRSFIVAHASLCAQALERVALAGAREELMRRLEDQRGRLETVLRQMPAGVLISDDAGTLVLSNAQAAEIWREPEASGLPARDATDRLAWHDDGSPYVKSDWPLARALGGATIVGEAIQIQRFDGARGWISVDAAPVRDRDGRIVAAVSTFTDVTEMREAQERQRFLGDASALLSSSLDYETTIERLAALAVPRMADWCSIDLVGANGALERPAIAHVDPSKVELAYELRLRVPPDPAAAAGVMAVIRTGKSELITDLPSEVFDSIADPELRRIIEDLQLHSYMCVPLVAGGEVLGAITFVGAESGRRYRQDDLAFAEELARRAASAVQNSRLFRDVSRYKRILDATLDAVFMFDPASLRLSYVNQGAIDQLGYDAGALLATTPTTLAVDLDDEQLRLLLRPLIEGRMESRTITLTLRHRSGRRLPVEVLLQHVVLPGEPGRIVAIARDIDDRVQAQARLQRLAEAEHARAAELNAVIRAMGEGVVVCGADGAITLTNPAAEELFPDAASRTYDAIIAQFEPSAAAPALGTRGGPVDLRLRGEAERWIEMSTYPVAARGPATEAEFDHGETIVLLRDVTVARQRQTVRDAFIGVLSHELRTPVTTIYAGSKVLARGSSSLDEDVRRSVFDDIHIEAERLHRLVEDVIALTRFGEEEAEIGDEPVLLQRILPAVVRSEEARWPGVSFVLRQASGLPTVVADATYVEQVVRNLLSNAAKYGGPESHVEVVVAGAGEEVLVRILDDGPGFPQGEADKLFDLYYRSPSTAGAASGAGIGLFVCARLIRAMGGRIWATSRPGGGAEFGFSLRVMAED